MKKLISLLVYTLILSAPAANAQSSGNAPPWSLYTIKGEHLTVPFPRVPALQTNKEVRTRPQKDRRRRVARASGAGVVYTIHVVDNPKPRLSLEAFIQEQAIVNSDKLTSERTLTLDGIAGKAFVYADGNGMAQFFAREDRLYDVRAYGAPVDDPRINTFFQHFSLKKTESSFVISESVQSASYTADAGIYSGKEVDTKARLISKPEPYYTNKARSKQITGTIVLKCIFAADGTVTNIYVFAGLPYGLTEKAIEAARKIKFIPATKDGKNVSMWMQLEYNFNLY